MAHTTYWPVGTAFQWPCIGIEMRPLMGEPDMAHVSTSYVERQNLTMRMSMRRFTRLTNAFSKKCANLEHAVALHFMHYNFCRVHQTLRVTPAMAAGLSNHVWELSRCTLGSSGPVRDSLKECRQNEKWTPDSGRGRTAGLGRGRRRRRR